MSQPAAQSKFSPAQSFLLYSGLHQIGQGQPILRRATCFTQSTDSSIILIEIQGHTQKNVSSDIWALQWLSQVDT